jgi:hypothetical protein
MRPNYRAINATRRKLLDNQEAARISEVARIASDLQRQEPKLTRSEALRLAERSVPHP